MFSYFAEVAKTTVSPCSSGIAGDGKPSAALSPLGPSRHSGIEKTVKQAHICTDIHLDTWLFVCVSIGLFKIPQQNKNILLVTYSVSECLLHHYAL